MLRHLQNSGVIQLQVQQGRARQEMDDLRKPQGAARTSVEKKQGAGEGEEQIFGRNEAQPIVIQGVD